MLVRPHLSEGCVTIRSPEDGGEGGGSGGGATLAQGVADLEALRAEVAKRDEKIAAFEKTEAERKAAADKGAADEIERAKKAGEYDKVIAAQNEELQQLRAKVAALEPDARYGAETRAQQRARIDAAKKDLPEADQKLLDTITATGNLQAADDLLQRLRAPGSKTARATPGGTPPPADAPDFDKLATEDPKGFQAAIRKYPVEWGAHKEKLRGPQTRQPTLQERIAMTAGAKVHAKA